MANIVLCAMACLCFVNVLATKGARNQHFHPSILVTKTPRFLWDQATESAEVFQGKVCHERCNGTEKVYHVDSSRCVQCFPCTCSTTCAKEGTCCPQLGDDWFPPHIERGQCVTDRSDPFTLEPSQCGYGDSGWGILQVVACDPGYPSGKVKTLCESWATLRQSRDAVPPVTSFLTSVTYANVHCAACNHDDEYLVEWGVVCDHSLLLYDALNDSQYDQRALQMPELCGFSKSSALRSEDYSTCDRGLYSDNVVSSCNVTGQWSARDERVLKACEESDWSRGALITGISRKYSNAFCALCNNELKVCLGRKDRTGEIVPGRISSDLIQFHPSVTVIETSIPLGDCPIGQWPHPQGECRDLQCAPGKVLRGGMCTTAVTRVKGLGYHLHLLLRPTVLRYHHTASATSASCHYGGALKAVTDEKFMTELMWDEVSDFTINITTAGSSDGVCYGKTYRSQLEDLMKHENVSRKVQGSHSTLELVVADMAQPKDTDFLRAQIQADILAPMSVKRDDFEEELVSRVFDRQWPVRFGQWTVMLEAMDMGDTLLHNRAQPTDLVFQGEIEDEKNTITYRKCNISPCWKWNDPRVRLQNLFLPLSRRLVYPHLTFKHDEFDLSSDKNSDSMRVRFPHFLGSDKDPVSFEAKFHPDGVWMTKDGQLAMFMGTYLAVFPDNVTVVKRVDHHETSLVLKTIKGVCGSVSVVCLAVTFVTYALFLELRTLPGLNNMGLSASLATAQLSLLLPLERAGSEGVCRAVGVFTHWAWLTALGWMNVCCVHMVRVFTSKTRRSPNDREVRKTFLRNVITTLLLPTLVVGLTVGVSVGVSGGSSMGYGGGVCFLDTEFHPLLNLAFQLPLALVVLTNLTCFVITVIAIVRVRRLQKRAPGREWKDVLVYVKLVTVTGGAWILGLLGAMMDSQWMRVVAELCIAAQGVLLFVAFVCNARVWRMYRARF